MNLAEKLRFSNLSLCVDTALTEGFGERVLRQNFEIANLAEECMAKNKFYEELLRKNGIKVDGLKNTFSAESHERSTTDTALLKYRD